ncbi:hypothetical protein V1517DRAFT_337514 [Lipomyces orientalis]|uniref:Uncharacterized protein n=1 Tax=Lipomyces orientalis TaxID=1233043 RepID=A0ACC3TRG8_9ASCO
MDVQRIQDERVPRSKKALRARAISQEAIETLKKPWLKETPYDIRDLKETIVIHSKHWGRRSGKHAFLRHMKSAEKLSEKLSSDSRLVMEGPQATLTCVSPGSWRWWNALQMFLGLCPWTRGVRSFVTGYSPDGEVVEFEKGDM